MNVILYNKKERVEHRSNINTLVYYPYCKLLGEIKRDYSTIYNLVIGFNLILVIVMDHNAMRRTPSCRLSTNCNSDTWS
jgi:hypothetical protein